MRKKYRKKYVKKLNSIKKTLISHLKYINYKLDTYSRKKGNENHLSCNMSNSFFYTKGKDFFMQEKYKTNYIRIF